jgi:Uma2 family endonuclease
MLAEVHVLESITPDQLRPLLRSEYDELIRQGKFQGEKIELLFGVLVRMTPIGAPHSSTVMRVTKLFWSLLPEARASVRCQQPFAALLDSEPEPDVVLAPPGEYNRDHPEKTLLVVEVSDSSLRRDRGLKARLYALAGVPEYWIVNLVDEVIEVYTEPFDDVFGQLTTYEKSDVIVPRAFPDLAIRVEQILK